jgi:hypothetical protein
MGFSDRFGPPHALALGCGALDSLPERDFLIW